MILIALQLMVVSGVRHAWEVNCLQRSSETHDPRSFRFKKRMPDREDIASASFVSTDRILRSKHRYTVVT